jgi:hypothetical protein
LCEHRRLSATSLRVVHGIRAPTAWPPKRGPERQGLHYRACSAWDGLFAWACAKNHASGVAKVTEHLVRSQSAPATRGICLQSPQPRN